jgi:hypothetical protein
MKIDIDKIRSLGMISKSLLNTWADACTILLEHREHQTPVKFEIEGALKHTTNLNWKSIKNKTGYEDLDEAAEFAGYGMSLLIVTTLNDLVPKSRRAKGDGVDIVCSKTIIDDDNFLNTTVEDYFLECKGSRNKASVKTHLTQGIKQSEKAPGNVYVISTEFETPSAITHFRK